MSQGWMRIHDENENEVKAYMNREIGDHVDPQTGEVNATTLAEDACCHFFSPFIEPLPDDADLVYGWAFEVAVKYESDCLSRRRDSALPVSYSHGRLKLFKD